MGIIIVGLWIYWHSNKLTPLIGGLLVGALLSITNAVKVINGEPDIINPFIKKGDKKKKTK